MKTSPFNGADRVTEHCIVLRLDVDLATETAIEEIRQHKSRKCHQKAKLNLAKHAVSEGTKVVTKNTSSK